MGRKPRQQQRGSGSDRARCGAPARGCFAARTPLRRAAPATAPAASPRSNLRFLRTSKARAIQAQGGGYCFGGPHPAPGGGWEAVQNPHTHNYAPFDLRLFTFARVATTSSATRATSATRARPTITTARTRSTTTMAAGGASWSAAITTGGGRGRRTSPSWAPGTTGTGPIRRSSGRTGRTTRTTTGLITRRITRAGATTTATAWRRQSRAFRRPAGGAHRRARPRVLAGWPGGTARPPRRLARHRTGARPAPGVPGRACHRWWMAR